MGDSLSCPSNVIWLACHAKTRLLPLGRWPLHEARATVTSNNCMAMNPLPPDHKRAPIPKLSDAKLLPASRQHAATAFQMIVVVAVCFVAGCARKPTQVITIGGLGFSQMGNVRRAIEKQCPNADVVSAGAWDAYKTDVSKIIRESPHDHVVLVGHSLGCQTIAQTAGKLSKVDLVVFIEPAGDDFRLPRSAERYLWYKRSNFDWVWQAKVIGASAATINGGHNDIAQSPQLIAEVVKAINGIKVAERR